MPEKQYEKEVQAVLDKECLCVGLSNSASIKYDQSFLKSLNAVTICPGPNIAYFSKVVSLQEMTDHIYGRTNIIEDADRPHVFVNELFIYIDYLKSNSLKKVKRWIRKEKDISENSTMNFKRYQLLSEGCGIPPWISGNF